MPIAKVHRISASAPDDISGIDAAIKSGRIDPKGVIAILAKTEGNGLVNDFSRGYATATLTGLFERHLPKVEAAKICYVMSGGTEGGMAPHWVVFTAMVTPRSARSSSSSGRAQVQWASVRRGLRKPISSRNRTMPSG